MPLRDQSTPLYENRTGTHLSTNIIILVNNRALAAVKTLAITESRGIQMINEIGTDGHIDSAPNKSTDISGSCQRTRFNRTRIAEAFDRGFIHVAAQRVPFEIVVQDNFQGSDDDSTVITTIRNVWIERIEVTLSSEDFIIVENMNWQAESIDSVLGNGQNVVGSVHNGNSATNIVNPFEASADRGNFRGALDGAGLINAFANGTL
jgi:hypothetical protein